LVADIIGSINKMNDIEIGVDAPVTEALMTKIGANINALIDLSGNFQVFTGNGTFTVPENITRLYVWGCGGGGGGGVNGNSKSSPPFTTDQCGGGGMGSVPIMCPLYGVTPLSNIAVTIGAGGAGSTVSGADGSSGGNTVFGSFLTFWGAPGGRGSHFLESNANPFPRFGNGQLATNLFSSAGKGETSIGSIIPLGPLSAAAPGGSTPYAPGGGVTTFGGGGGAGFGAGGAGSGTFIGIGVSAAANSGAGGGGGGTSGSGNGGSGILVVFW